MKTELIAPTATLAVAILERYNGSGVEIPNEVIASAFQQAYQGLLLGIAQVDEEEQRGKPSAVEQFAAMGR